MVAAARSRPLPVPPLALARCIDRSRPRIRAEPASRVNSMASRVLPTPLSPPTSTARPSPPCTESSSSFREAMVSFLPTKAERYRYEPATGELASWSPQRVPDGSCDVACVADASGGLLGEHVEHELVELRRHPRCSGRGRGGRHPQVMLEHPPGRADERRLSHDRFIIMQPSQIQRSARASTNSP